MFIHINVRTIYGRRQDPGFTPIVEVGDTRGSCPLLYVYVCSPYVSGPSLVPVPSVKGQMSMRRKVFNRKFENQFLDLSKRSCLKEKYVYTKKKTTTTTTSIVYK